MVRQAHHERAPFVWLRAGSSADRVEALRQSFGRLRTGLRANGVGVSLRQRGDEVRETVTKYLRLARVTSWPSFSLSFMIPFAVGAYGGTDWAAALVGFAALLLFAAFAFALNFYSDRASDVYHDGKEKEFNLSRQPMTTGEVTERECQVFCVVTLAGALALGFVAGTLFGVLVVAACVIGGILYSHPWIRFKAKPVGDIACLVALDAVLFAGGYLLARDTILSWQVLLFLSIFATAGTIPPIAYDYTYDARAGLKTSAVVFGQRNLVRAMWVLCLCALPVAWLVGSQPGTLAARVALGVACAAMIGYTYVTWKSFRTPGQPVPLLTGHPSREILFSAVISLSALCYALVRILLFG